MSGVTCFTKLRSRVADRRNKTPPGMGWNVYDEAPRAAASSHYIGEDEKEVLAEIFFQHAVSGAEFWMFFWGWKVSEL